MKQAEHVEHRIASLMSNELPYFVEHGEGILPIASLVADQEHLEVVQQCDMPMVQEVINEHGQETLIHEDHYKVKLSPPSLKSKNEDEDDHFWDHLESFVLNLEIKQSYFSGAQDGTTNS